jgi:hypothetical protein
MKKALLILITLTSVISSVNAQITIRDLHESVAKLNDSLYFSKYEVSNHDYMDFIRALRKAHDTLGLEIALMDTMQWKAPGTYNEPYVTYYHTHPAYSFTHRTGMDDGCQSRRSFSRICF